MQWIVYRQQDDDGLFIDSCLLCITFIQVWLLCCDILVAGAV